MGFPLFMPANFCGIGMVGGSELTNCHGSPSKLQRFEPVNWLGLAWYCRGSSSWIAVGLAWDYRGLGSRIGMALHRSSSRIAMVATRLHGRRERNLNILLGEAPLLAYVTIQAKIHEYLG